MLMERNSTDIILGSRALPKHQGSMPRVCRPYRAKTKGKVEHMNGYLRHSFWVPLVSMLKQAGLTADCGLCNERVIL
ncbi:hypothetical protein SAMN06265784_11946 [Paraburkholderia susongensis]|uniref:Uncharacterized protein n=1 Tax=Paraburkholderia susongensis TaxID=1515439 RepID=A0A1X7M6H3_9BURK|nr:hypothetical protein SAMN06265784_11946 [Paraburkholderia susongensis]